ncbi:DUF3368 domain-containing protein [Spirulina sp. CS-785/01]|uniref:DUF3368 domain-containing protein n=1 Tax=Spirulina sp. CS-785/01 TaxID=3021716 RepID=UPI0023311E9F|nr:DUF3368 domain-containing protein [Spirulina sp. CS-785/01]MDB9314254.1 DUF3368 domain-containing protein [Spirulina sp. CS-785/01]
MAESPAINTSPLIFLSKANLIHLLQIISPKIVVPEAVAQEIQAYGKTDITAQTLATIDWLMIKPMPEVPTVIQNWDLGLGESAVLTWGYTHPETEIILDDLAGRRCAKTLNIPMRGTLGLVLTAKQRGEIPAARPVVEQLRLSGMYLSNRVIDQALALVGE